MSAETTRLRDDAEHAMTADLLRDWMHELWRSTPEEDRPALLAYVTMLHMEQDEADARAAVAASVLIGSIPRG